jgi:hypothetical protein
MAECEVEEEELTFLAKRGLTQYVSKRNVARFSRRGKQFAVECGDSGGRIFVFRFKLSRIRPLFMLRVVSATATWVAPEPAYL